MNNNAKNKTKQIVGIGVMTAIIAVLSQITIPLPTHVPVTLQTFAVALAGYFLGWKGGAVSALVYGLLGAIGVPVFAGWSGGFCAESENLLENAKAKIQKKGCDFLIANDISRKDIGFNTDENEVYIIDKSLNIKHIEKDTKENIAQRILEEIFE